MNKRLEIETKLLEMHFEPEVIDYIESQTNESFSDEMQEKITKHYNFIKCRNYVKFKFRNTADYEEVFKTIKKYSHDYHEDVNNRTLSNSGGMLKFMQLGLFKSGLYNFVLEVINDSKGNNGSRFPRKEHLMEKLAMINGFIRQEPDIVEKYMNMFGKSRLSLEEKIKNMEFVTKNIDSIKPEMINDKQLQKRIAASTTSQFKTIYKLVDIIENRKKYHPDMVNMASTLLFTEKNSKKDGKTKYLFSDLSIFDFDNKERIDYLKEKFNFLKSALQAKSSFVLHNKNIDIFILFTSHLNYLNKDYMKELVDNFSEIRRNIGNVNNKQLFKLEEFILCNQKDAIQIFKDTTASKVVMDFASYEKYGSIFEYHDKMMALGVMARSFNSNDKEIKVFKSILPKIDEKYSSKLCHYLIENEDIRLLDEIKNKPISEIYKILDKMEREQNIQREEQKKYAKDLNFLNKLKP